MLDNLWETNFKYVKNVKNPLLQKDSCQVGFEQMGSLYFKVVFFNQ